MKALCAWPREHQDERAYAQAKAQVAGERMRDKAAERAVPAEVRMAVVRLGRHDRARRPRQPLHRMMRLKPRLAQAAEVDAADRPPRRARHVALPAATWRRSHTAR